jgi:hypothetical protein
VYRQHNDVADMGTNFSNIPYPFSPQFGENEFHGSARGSRLSLLAEGVLDPVQKLTGYFEMDFLGTGVNSNYNQSNSWAPRARQLYSTYDNTEWGFHFLAGQAWSLLTQNTVGITPRKENIPTTIESSYVAGFDYTRNWQLRVVKDFGSWASFGLSVENPAELVYSSTGAVASGGNVGGFLVNYANVGSNFLASGTDPTTFTPDVAPDIIGKAAFDPGWGHYEVFGIARFFNDNTFGRVVSPATVAGPPAQTAGLCSTVVANTLVPGAQSQRTKSGDGVGGSVLLPIIPKYRRHPGLDHVRQRHRPLWRLAIVRCRRRARWFPGAHQSLPRIGRNSRAPLGRAGHLRLCRNGAGTGQLLEHRLLGLHQRSDRLWCTDRDQHRMQHHHRCLVYRRDLELRRHQQVGEFGHRRLLAGPL